ncbi:MAG: ERF family protein [Ignavibacteria bacterium]|nr:ERF family protein [Ignavibacteria bacterium]
MKSETIGEIAKALAAAQGMMKAAPKDATNPFFKSHYADLASVWDTARKPLADNGLSVTQTTRMDGDKIILETTLLHQSGEWISGDLALKPVKDDPQGQGSAITYARRYALSAIIGISTEDDDGNEASKQATKTATVSNRTPQPAQTPPAASPIKQEAKSEESGLFWSHLENIGQLLTRGNSLGLKIADIYGDLGEKSNKEITQEPDAAWAIVAQKRNLHPEDKP